MIDFFFLIYIQVVQPVKNIEEFEIDEKIFIAQLVLKSPEI